MRLVTLTGVEWKFISDLCVYSRVTAAVALRVAYGYEVQNDNDPIVGLVKAAMGSFSQANVPGAFLVDVFPYGLD